MHADGTREIIGTDGTWREHTAEWLPAPPRNDEGGFIERVDGRLHPHGLGRSPASTRRGWTPVAVLGPAGTKPFTHLVVQRTHIVEHAGAAGLGAHAAVGRGRRRLRRGHRGASRR